MAGSVIVAGARTPIGKLSGAFASLSAMDLGGIAIKAALERAGVTPDRVKYVFMGQVLLAGQGQNPSRVASVNAGIGMDVPTTTINKVCLSGLNSIYLADLMIQAGEADIVVAGGMESMTQAPHLLSGARAGYKLGDGTLVDSMMHDGLTCSFDHCAMGLATERYAAGTLSREAQDAFSANSHERAAAAIKDGRFDAEIAEITERLGDPIGIVVHHLDGAARGNPDEGITIGLGLRGAGGQQSAAQNGCGHQPAGADLQQPPTRHHHLVSHRLSSHGVWPQGLIGPGRMRRFARFRGQLSQPASFFPSQKKKA